MLVVFLLVFLFDTFLSKNAQSKLTVFATVLFGVFTVASFFIPMKAGQEVAFAGMFITSPIVMCIKNILNVGLFHKNLFLRYSALNYRTVSAL